MLKTVVVNIGYIMFGMYLCYEKKWQFFRSLGCNHKGFVDFVLRTGQVVWVIVQ